MTSTSTGVRAFQPQYALVMELVEGEDLAQRIGHRAIPLDEALPIAKPGLLASRCRISPM